MIKHFSNIKQKPLFFILLIFIVCLAIYYRNLHYYFFQDDWFILNNVQIKSLPQFLNLFKVGNDVIYYRPIGMQLFFTVGDKLFGLNPFGFHLISLLFHFTNIILFYVLSMKLFKNPKIGLIAAFIYGISAFHFMTISWLSLTWNFIGLTSTLLCLIHFLNYRKSNKVINYLASIFFLLLALGSTEFALTVPLLLVLLDFLNKNYTKKTLVQMAKTLSPFLLICVFYVFLRFYLIPIPIKGDYTLTFSTLVIKDYFWYFMWFFNIPELLRDHFNATNLQISADFLRVSMPVLPVTIVCSVASILIFAFLLVKIGIKKLYKLIVVTVIYFVFGLFPVIFLKNHAYPYYLTMPSVPLILLTSVIAARALEQPRAKRIAIVFLVLYLSSSYLANSVNRQSHWLVGEQGISRKAVEKARLNLPSPNDKSVIVVMPSSIQIKQALMDQQAFRFVYKLPVTTVYDPANGPSKDVILIKWNE